MNLVEMLRLQTDRAADPDLEDEIRQCLAFPNVDHNMLARVAAARLNHKHPAGPRMKPPDPAECCKDDFLISTLAKIYFTDSDLEPTLKALRRALLLEILSSGTLCSDRVGLITAMALQGANNEYVYGIDDQEKRMLAALLQLQEALIAGDGPSTGLLGAVLAAAMYMPICDMPVAHRLQSIHLTDWPENVRPLISSTLLDRLVEREIAAAVPRLLPIRDEVSKLVKAQYEEHPYPRWLSVAYRPKVSYRADLQSRLPRAELPDILDRGKLEVLVAGCGTGRQPISIAKTYKDISVTALDLSSMSLAYGMRMAAGMGIDNIEFHQGDILDLPHLDKRFALIYCSGVLHHMRDPVAGWRVLCGMLEPGGMMNIALYSERARAVIARAREIIAGAGIGNDAEAIRGFRRDVLAGR
ncbi:class I SAM-dependent methyltransferase, partial [bacterium]|nr:class I SAM-dependent methyltransferase [bacterium]